MYPGVPNAQRTLLGRYECQIRLPHRVRVTFQSHSDIGRHQPPQSPRLHEAAQDDAQIHYDLAVLFS